MKAIFVVIVCHFMLASLVSSELLDLEKLLKSMDTQKSAAGHRDSESIPKPLLDEFTTYVDRLMASHDTSNLEQSELNREMKFDFNELRKALANDLPEKKTLEPGQVPALACSKTPYGCCPDGTAAPSTGKEGCAARLCEDVYKDQCNDLLLKGELNCRIMWKKCPYSCNRCDAAKALAAPIRACEQNNPGAFCCWDGMPGTGPDGRQCRPCVDHYRRACAIFKNVSRGCRSNSWRIRNFMQNHCPNTCGMCGR